MPPPEALQTVDRETGETGETLHRRRRAASLPPEARRSMILNAAVPLLVAAGDKVTTQEIAAAAGIAEGTIFRVFASKEELIEAAVDRVLDNGPTEEAIAALDPGQGLEATVTAAAGLLQRRFADVWRLISSVGPRYQRPERVKTFESAALVRLLEAFRAELDVEPAEAARLLRSVTLAWSHTLITPEPLTAEQVAHRFLHGVVKAPC